MELEQQLASVPLLAGLPERTLRHLAFAGKRRVYTADQVIVEEGAGATAFYIVLRGQARVEQRGEQLGGLKPGDFFGELALIEKHARTASVIAESEVECLLFPVWEFSALLEEYPEIAVPIMKALIARLHRREHHGA